MRIISFKSMSLQTFNMNLNAKIMQIHTHVKIYIYEHNSIGGRALSTTTSVVHIMCMLKHFILCKAARRMYKNFMHVELFSLSARYIATNEDSYILCAKLFVIIIMILCGTGEYNYTCVYIVCVWVICCCDENFFCS